MSASSRNSKKRKNTSPSVTSSKRSKAEAPKVKDKDSRGSVLNAEEQLATYAMEQFSASGLRSHTLGIIVKDTEMTLCYYDREGCIQSKAFDFLKNFDDFCAIMISFHMLNAYQWGFSPYLEIQPGVMPHCGNDESAVTTTIGNMRVRLTKVNYQQNGLVGRGTSVYDAIVIDELDDVEKEIVVKCSWQVTTRLQVHETIKQAWDRLLAKKEHEKFVENIPEVYIECETFIMLPVLL